jgi:hypothetical protein
MAPMGILIEQNGSHRQSKISIDLSIVYPTEEGVYTAQVQISG